MYYLDKRDNMLCIECGKDNEEDNILCREPLKYSHITCHACNKGINEDPAIYVRLHAENGSYKFFRKIEPRKYELHPDYLNYGFKSKSVAEKRAREIEEIRRNE